MWDMENRKYLDFTAGIAVNGLGHCDPEMSKLLYQQVTEDLHCEFDTTLTLPRPAR